MKITFSAPEKQWLIQLLDNRLFVYSYSKGVPVKVIEMAKVCRRKLLEADTVLFSPKQAALCTGCLNEQLDHYFKELTIKAAQDLLNLSAEQKYIADQIDMGKDLLVKLGYEKRTHFPTYNYQVRYRQTLEAIDKIRDAKDIYLSKTSDRVYKIGFVTQDQEVFSWELSYDLSVHDISTFPKDAKGIEDHRKNFMMSTSKERALELLTEFPYPGHNATAFFKTLLN